MPKSPEELAHQEWLGYVQPVGLVVSTPAMLQAQCYVNKNIMVEHACLLSCLPREHDQPIREIRDLAEFTQEVLGWEAEDLVEVPQRAALTDEFRNEVLARLLELNEQRHKEELLLAKQAAPADKAKKTSGGKSKGKTKRDNGPSKDRSSPRELF